MPNTLSLDFKSSALLIALVLVPVVVLFGTVAIALVCSERCNCHFAKPKCVTHFPCCRGRWHRKKRLRSDLENGSDSPATETSNAPLQYGPVSTALEQV
ncbi:uncharacterized protein N7477_002288 [Penicillium maclennaniae]|uniref:uncharacterized protein n=1 Tax=Penicillium maclennaniae TaxID=1343394 RepID=UPI0025425BC9|nr:uncharacterized protein N7477_002288 [Penicillium maclennaniae]KAJ5676655.1 hypothetical protein N7477_002288 [Penicillium maclennaniae]